MRLKELPGTLGLGDGRNRDKVDEDKNDGMDAETCSELCQYSDDDGSEFRG